MCSSGCSGYLCGVAVGGLCCSGFFALSGQLADDGADHEDQTNGSENAAFGHGFIRGIRIDHQCDRLAHIWPFTKLAEPDIGIQFAGVSVFALCDIEVTLVALDGFINGISGDDSFYLDGAVVEAHVLNKAQSHKNNTKNQHNGGFFDAFHSILLPLQYHKNNTPPGRTQHAFLKF